MKINHLLANAQPKPSGVPLDHSTVQTVREWLAGRYARRHRQKMADRLPVNLHFHASLQGIWQRDHSSFIEVPVEEAAGRIRRVFEQTKGRLLLLGAPGAGKTLQIIQLAQDLLDSEPDAMPVLLNLATWTSEHATLLDWLKKSLPYELGTNEALAMKLLAHRRVILLLDGFDEIAVPHRVSFFEKMAEYLAERPHTEFVISSRVQEYLAAAAEKTPPVEHQPVEVAPLSLDQIRHALRDMEAVGQPGARRFLAALDTDPLLCEAAAKPFYFNCLQSLFALKTWTEWKFSATEQEGREAEIAERFIEQELKKCSDPATRKWLGFLAFRMVAWEVVVFELTDLQYSWRWPRQWDFGEILTAEIVDGVRIGLTLGLILGLGGTFGGWVVFGILDGWRVLIEILTTILFAGIEFGLMVGLMLGFFNFLTDNFKSPSFSVYTVDRIQLTWTAYIKQSIFIGLSLGLVIGFAIHLADRGLVFRWRLTDGLVIGLFLGTTFGIILGILEASKPIQRYFLQISHPYQRFTASAKNLHFSILQHGHLRWLLARKGLLPLRLVDFLNEMAPLEKNQPGEEPRRRFSTAQVYLMETDGATWRFRHRIIQEWFAARGAASQ